MLEHADRNDAVEGLADVAIILKAEFDVLRQAGLAGAAFCDGELLLGQGDPGHPRAGDARKIEREAPEPAADIKRRRALLDQELGGEMAPLGGLSVVERLAGACARG